MAAIPNVLSTLRLVLAVVFPVLTADWRVVAAITAAVSDGLDGYIARRFDATSVVGGILDAIGDKLFVGIAVVTLTVEGAWPVWCTPLVLLRDLSVAGSALVVTLSREWWAFRHMPPHELGKVTTTLQFLVILAGLAVPAATTWLLVPTIAASAAAAATYVSRFWRIRPRSP